MQGGQRQSVTVPASQLAPARIPWEDVLSARHDPPPCLEASMTRAFGTTRPGAGAGESTPCPERYQGCWPLCYDALQEGQAMPLLDHFHAPLSPLRSWESFHSTWVGA